MILVSGPIRCRFGGKLSNLRKMQAETKVQADVFLSADDTDKQAISEAKMQEALNQVSHSKFVKTMTLQSAEKKTAIVNQHMEGRIINQPLN